MIIIYADMYVILSFLESPAIPSLLCNRQLCVILTFVFVFVLSVIFVILSYSVCELAVIDGGL